MASCLIWKSPLSSIELHRAALELHPDPPWPLSSTILHRVALELYPPGHSGRSTSLDNLTVSLQCRFFQRGVLSDLDEAIELHWSSAPLVILIDPHLSAT